MGMSEQMNNQPMPQWGMELEKELNRTGSISWDEESRMNYGHDWTKLIESNACAVVFPESTEEVSKILKFCFNKAIQVVPSGGRTGLSGGAIAANGELVISLIRMNKIIHIDPLSKLAHVQAGAITESVHAAAAEQDLYWPVDFASKGSSTVGGNISTNAGGVKVVRYGLTRDTVLGLTVVLADGEILKLNGDLIKNNIGYDIRQLFISGEGTLGIITEASLRLVKLPRDYRVFFFAVSSFSEVLTLFSKLNRSRFTLSAFEMLSEKCLENVSKIRGLSRPFSSIYPMYVLVELEVPEFGLEEFSAALNDFLEHLFESSSVQDGVLATNSREVHDLWALREGISESLSARGVLHKNDIALPIRKLDAFLSEFSEGFATRYPGWEVFVFGHIGDGNLHINILKPESTPLIEFRNECKTVDNWLYPLCRKHSGTLSAEHGIGLLKKDALAAHLSARELQLYDDIKRVFDPTGIVNRGKIRDWLN